MGKCSTEYTQVRFYIQDGFTECYVAMTAIGDCPLGVQGWHYKVFPKEISAIDILNGFAGKDDPVLWAQKAPEEV